jgi:hypothetical protein
VWFRKSHGYNHQCLNIISRADGLELQVFKHAVFGNDPVDLIQLGVAS